MRHAPYPVSLRQLQYVAAVAEARSFRRAAEACGVSQPSLSAQVAEAESGLGVRLFELPQLAHELVELGVGDFRILKVVIALFVMPDQVAKVGNAG